MSIEKLYIILTKNNRVTFKFYSLDYQIDIVDDKFQIFSLVYTKRIKKYNTIC